LDIKTPINQTSKEQEQALESFLTWDREAANRFPTLLVCVGVIHGVKVERSNLLIEALRRTVTEDVRSKFNLKQLKDDPIVRVYRDLFWALGIDPTKTRPSGEALLRRVLHGDEIPRISSVVDAYNLASVKTIIPLSGFDLDQISPPLTLRFSHEGEEFHGIGINKPITVADKMLVVADTKRIVCIYPHRDADATKITEKIMNVPVISYGAPQLASIKQTSGGTIGAASAFKPVQTLY
jgi:DNA/RNA-binding domain of Phe-tRNA-synthetase-like protein